VIKIISFLGICSYHRKLIPGHSNLTAPLTKLTKQRNHGTQNGHPRQGVGLLPGENTTSITNEATITKPCITIAAPSRPQAIQAGGIN
jgi:hypothetical protein